VTHTVKPARLVVAVLACALVPLGWTAPAVLTLGTAAALVMCLVAFEALRPDRFRRAVTEGR